MHYATHVGSRWSADHVLAGSKQPLRLLVRFTASGQIASLRVLAPDEAAPW